MPDLLLNNSEFRGVNHWLFQTFLKPSNHMMDLLIFSVVDLSLEESESRGRQEEIG